MPASSIFGQRAILRSDISGMGILALPSASPGNGWIALASIVPVANGDDSEDASLSGRHPLYSHHLPNPNCQSAYQDTDCRNTSEPTTTQIEHLDLANLKKAKKECQCAK